MARPLKADRDAVASETLTLRLTAGDRAMLDALVAAAAAELEQSGIELTATAYVRGLIRREASRSRAAAPAHTQAAAPAVERRTAARPSTPDENRTRSMLDRVLAKGVRQTEVCRLSGLDSGHLSRWKGRKQGISDVKLAALAKALESL